MTGIDLDAYRRDGFVVVPGLVGRQAVDTCLADIAGLFRRQADAAGLDAGLGFSDLLTRLFALDMPRYLATAKVAQHLVALHRIGVSDPVLALTAALGLRAPTISTRPVLQFMADALKVPGGYHKTPPHQDWRSVQGSLNGITIWIPFTDTGLDDYPLEVVPGSHRRGLLASAEDPFGHRLAADEYADAEYRQVPVPAGSAVAFSGFLVHRTGARGTGRVRVSVNYRFNDAAEPTFIARRYPDTYRYKADMTLLEPSPATAEAVAGWFDQPGDVG